MKYISHESLLCIYVIVFQWSRNGQVENSSFSLTFPENASRQLLITANRIVSAEIDTQITATVLGGGQGNLYIGTLYSAYWNYN